MKVLIVEDDGSIARFLAQALTEAGYDADIAEDGLEACSRAATGAFDLILLDVMLPKMDGFEVCRHLRAQGLATPVLIITARDTLDDKVKGLDSGADDYIVKPFQLPELFARVRALLRRGAFSPTPLQEADLVLDPAAHVVVRAGKPIHLSATEFTLLEYLLRNKGRLLTRQTILQHVWEYDFGGRDNVLDVYISYLRGKIDRGFHPRLIHTVRGIGFILSAHYVA
ncbi:MAG: response regulator transcription factor [Chthonomonadales bacterium]